MEIEDLHRLACSRKEETYIDPRSGLTVFTEYAHTERGTCCGCGCRHCPYRRKQRPSFYSLLVALWRRVVLCVSALFPPRSEERRKSKVYTRTGDAGTTRLIDGAVPKYGDACEAMGAVDELAVKLGIASRACRGWWSRLIRDRIERVQLVLLQGGAVLAAAELTVDFDTEDLEADIDRIDATLPKLSNFVVPNGDSPLSALTLHDARVVCRRAERAVWRHLASSQVVAKNPQTESLARYLNRLSDFLFVAARKAANSQQWFSLQFFLRRQSGELSYDVRRDRKLHPS